MIHSNSNNLSLLSDSELDASLKKSVKTERELLHLILLTIKEISRRKAYLELGYDSLFSYLTVGLNYSAAAAQRRIDGARLLAEVPQLSTKIKNGSVKLEQISLIQKASRLVAKTNNAPTEFSKLELIQKIEHKSYKESEAVVAEYFDLPILNHTQQTHQADQSVRIELTISKDLHARIQQAQTLLSHSLKSSDIVDFLDYISEKVIQQKTGLKTGIKTGITPDHPESARTSDAEVKNKNLSLPSVRGQPFSAKIKKQILREQKCCQFRDPVTNKQCQSTWFLQIDHKTSLWAGGANDFTNAQLLCAAHNQYKYRKESGIKLY